MRRRDLDDYIAHFRARVLQDALAQATAAYWRRRAEVWEAARPRPGDFTGAATTEELAEANMRCAATALACRQRAAVSLLWDDPDDADLVECCLAEAEAAEGVA